MDKGSESAMTPRERAMARMKHPRGRVDELFEFGLKFIITATLKLSKDMVIESLQGLTDHLYDRWKDTSNTKTYAQRGLRPSIEEEEAKLWGSSYYTGDTTKFPQRRYR